MYFNNDGGGNAVRNAVTLRGLLGRHLNRLAPSGHSAGRPEPGPCGRVEAWNWRHSNHPQQQPVTGNRAFRLAHWVSDTVNSLRLKTARRWDFVPQTVAYQGYGSTTWVRVLGRVVLTSKPDARQPGGAGSAERQPEHPRLAGVHVRPDPVLRGGDRDRRA